MAMAKDDTKTMTTAGDDKAGEVAAQCIEALSEADIVKEIDLAIGLCNYYEHLAEAVVLLDDLHINGDAREIFREVYKSAIAAWPVARDERGKAILRIANLPANSAWTLNAKARLIGAAIVGRNDSGLEPETAVLLQSVAEDAQRLERQYLLSWARSEDARRTPADVSAARGISSSDALALLRAREAQEASAARGVPLKGYVDDAGEVFAFSGNQADLIPPLRNG